MGFFSEHVGNGTVVLVYENDDLLLVIPLQYVGEVSDGRSELFAARGTGEEGIEEHVFVRGQAVVIQKIQMLLQGVQDDGPHGIEESLVVRGFGVLHVQGYDRVCVAVSLELRVLGYCQIIEPGIAFVLDVEEGIEHG